MPEMNRRAALGAALCTGAAGMAPAEEAPANEAVAAEETMTQDQQFVMAAGLSKAEADCWKKIAEAAGAFFSLPEQHPMDRQEVASAIHIVQNKLLARPTYRKYLELAKAAQKDNE